MSGLRNFIGGTYRDASASDSMPVVDPSTGTEYERAPVSGPADVGAACRAAADAFERWRRTTPAQRSLALVRFADAMEARAEDFVAAECRNTGKPLRWMREEEFPMVLDHLRFMATIARNLHGVATASYAPGYDSAVRREPLGVCGQVAPWNYPLLMAVWKFGPALAAGNTVVLKPSDSTPVTTSMLGEIAAEHLPAGVFNVVVGDRDTGRALVEHPAPALISVAGGQRVDPRLRDRAADEQRPGLRPGLGELPPDPAGGAAERRVQALRPRQRPVVLRPGRLHPGQAGHERAAALSPQPVGSRQRVEG